jgi:RNA polymerase sigma-70 factor (ECF subfamily)
MNSLANFQHRSKFSTWFRTLIRRRIADYYRSRKPVVQFSLEQDNPGSDHTPLEEILVEDKDEVNLDDVILVRQALLQLPEHYREIILLRFVEGLKFKEIADCQDQSLEATKSLFRRAIASLQDLLSDT